MLRVGCALCFNGVTAEGNRPQGEPKGHTMQTIAAVYNRSADRSQVTAFTERHQAGSLLAYVLEDSAGHIYFQTPDRTRTYGEGEFVAPAVRNKRMRATIAARREFGGSIVVA